MSDASMQALLLAAALLSSVVGSAWLALAMDAHWVQVRGPQTVPAAVCTLRVLGVAALMASLMLCLMADHPTMAVLVWVMALAGAALVVALMLSWRARWLAPLAAPFTRRP
jgi:hypothetical protein